LEARRLVSHKVQRNLRESSGGNRHSTSCDVSQACVCEKANAIQARLKRVASAATKCSATAAEEEGGAKQMKAQSSELDS
jgi:hypothetical protein